jgi:sulfate transport system ATP-binding protein
MNIGIERLDKRFGNFHALHGLDLRIASGELLAVLGPSGSGKTTLLRALAGLESPDAGRILFGEHDATRLSMRERRVGLVFQHYALFPHLSVFENVAFGLRTRPRRDRPKAAELRRRVGELLERMQIGELRERMPDQLSGGQKQRVALARAMAIEPSVLLLDEPFGALDAKVRVELRRWLRHIHEETGYTTILVTHDQDEALELADRVVVMQAGQIAQIGAPDAVYAEPASAWVYDFLGRSNQINGLVAHGIFRADGDALRVACADVADGPARLFVRPHDMLLVDNADTSNAATLSAMVTDTRRVGGRCVLTLRVTGQSRPLELDLPDAEAQAKPSPGATVRVQPRRYRVFAGG